MLRCSITSVSPQSRQYYVGCSICCGLSGIVQRVRKWFNRKNVEGESNCPPKQNNEPVNFCIQVMSKVTGVSEEEITNDFAIFFERFGFVLIHPFSSVLQFEQNFVFQFLECRNLPFSYFGAILSSCRSYEGKIV
jgi:hypothetical protein